MNIEEQQKSKDTMKKDLITFGGCGRFLPLLGDYCKRAITHVAKAAQTQLYLCEECAKRYAELDGWTVTKLDTTQPIKPQVEEQKGAQDTKHDPVNHPKHYTGHPSGVECITITEHLNFCLGNAIKYIWRAGEKGDALEDLKKARWYVDREIARRSKA